jgi:hypothetical protein
MQLWSKEGAFVDMLDGYTYLPALTDRVLFDTLDEYGPSNLSTILHEFTHQLTLHKTFGLVCAYHTAVHAANTALAHFEAQAYISPINPSREKIQGEAARLYLAHYSSNLQSFFYLIHAYRWLEEGLALFTQLDYQPSNEYEAAAQHFELMTALRAARRRANDDPPDIRAVLNLFAAARASQDEAELRWFLFRSTDPQHRPYYAGYLLIREIQRELSKSDPRLADPEVFLIFMLGYFFNDIHLLDLCVQTKPQFFKPLIKDHIYRSLATLIAPDINRLRAAVDRIASFENYDTDFHLLDYAAILRGEQPRDLSPEELSSELERRLRLHCSDQWAQVFLASDLPSPPGVDIKEAAVARSFITFRVIFSLYNFFKLRHTQRVLVTYRYDESNQQVLITSGARSGAFWGLETWTASEFAPLARQIKEEHLQISNEQKLQWTDGQQMLAEVDKLKRPCLLEEYVVYDIRARECLHILLRGDFLRVRNVGDVDQPPLNQQFLEHLGAFFDRSSYWDLVSVPVPAHIPAAKNFLRRGEEIEEDVLEIAWRLVFRKVNPSRSGLQKFWDQKSKTFAIGDDHQSLLQRLCRKGRMSISQDLAQTVSDVEQINRRWARFGGGPLMEVHNQQEDSAIVRILF